MRGCQELLEAAKHLESVYRMRDQDIWRISEDDWREAEERLSLAIEQVKEDG